MRLTFAVVGLTPPAMPFRAALSLYGIRGAAPLAYLAGVSPAPLIIDYNTHITTRYYYRLGVGYMYWPVCMPSGGYLARFARHPMPPSWHTFRPWFISFAAVYFCISSAPFRSSVGASCAFCRYPARFARLTMRQNAQTLPNWTRCQSPLALKCVFLGRAA